MIAGKEFGPSGLRLNCYSLKGKGVAVPFKSWEDLLVGRVTDWSLTKGPDRQTRRGSKTVRSSAGLGWQLPGRSV